MYLLDHVYLMSNSIIYLSLIGCFIVTNLRLDRVVDSIVGIVFSLVEVKVFESFKIKNIINKVCYIVLKTSKDTIAVAVHSIDYIITIHFIDLVIVASFKLIDNTEPSVVNIIEDFFTSFIDNIVAKVMATFALEVIITIFFIFCENVFFVIFYYCFFLRPFLVLFYVF